MGHCSKADTVAVNRPHQRPDSWVWLDNLEPVDLLPIIGKRLRAAREQPNRVTMAKLAARTGGAVSSSRIDEIEKGGGNIRKAPALAIARALSPEGGDPSYLLWWLVNPEAVLAGPDAEPLSPSAQVAEYHRKATVRAAQAKLLLAERQQSGKWGEWVELGDGTRMMVVRAAPREG